MRVALDISPINSAHKVRGIGTYTQNLKTCLEESEIDLTTFDTAESKVSADIFHFPYFDLFFKTLKPRKNAKNVVTIHDVIPLIFPNNFPRGFRANFNLHFQKNALKDVDAIICDSNSSKTDIVEKLNVKQEKVHTIYLAASKSYKKITDSNLLNKISQKHKLPEEFALYVGDVNWNKNVIGLLAAIKIAGINLVLVGKALVDESLPQVRQIDYQIEKLKLASKVQKLGYVPEEDLVGIYNLARVTVCPSFYEGFGLPVLESMACGTPVVSADNSSLSEIGKGASFFCNPLDEQSIAGQITNVLSLTKEQRQDLAPKLIKHSKSFSWSRVAEETIAVYKSLI